MSVGVEPLGTLPLSSLSIIKYATSPSYHQRAISTLHFFRTWPYFFLWELSIFFKCNLFELILFRDAKPIESLTFSKIGAFMMLCVSGNMFNQRVFIYILVDSFRLNSTYFKFWLFFGVFSLQYLKFTDLFNWIWIRNTTVSWVWQFDGRYATPTIIKIPCWWPTKSQCLEFQVHFY